MSIIQTLREKAKADKKHILLPEGSEPRTVQAAAIIVKEGLADITLLGNFGEIQKVAMEHKVDLSGVNIIDPMMHEKFSDYAEMFYEMRKKKGISMDDAREQMKNTLYYSAMMLKCDDADGFVAGAINTTGNTLKPALQIIKTKPGIPIVSSCFLMELPQGAAYGDDGILFFGDCAVNINPSAAELAAIAQATAETAKALLGMEARIAMLSFSTKGSAKDPLVDKVVEATKLLKEQAPQLLVDGELQADAALVEAVGQLKSPGSPVAGKANVLIFPDLQAGNIGYKLVQRMAGAEAIGPICQGMAKPVNDLSRGCSVEDVVNVVAITALQAQSK
ncbi:phosphate acetyltransferase [Clostridia bacterium OttesenSCG-928-F22]|nr:phosphate acetyltransferase [Clostridia bacterium OttesenSCG-928-F22]